MGFDEAFAFAKVVASKLGAVAPQILLNLRGFADESEDEALAESSADEPLYGALGILSRPKPADADGNAEAVAARTSDGLVPVALRDLRIAAARGAVKEGSSNLAGYGGAFVDIEPAASGTGDTVIVYVPYQHAGGAPGKGAPAKAHSLTMKTDSGDESVLLLHALGQGVVMNNDGDLILKSKGGARYIQINETEIMLGGVIKLFGGTIVGGPATAQPVALYPPLAALATALGTLSTALATAFGAGTWPPPNAAAVASAASALATAATALAVPATGAASTLKASPV